MSFHEAPQRLTRVDAGTARGLLIIFITSRNRSVIAEGADNGEESACAFKVNPKISQTKGICLGNKKLRLSGDLRGRLRELRSDIPQRN